MVDAAEHIGLVGTIAKKYAKYFTQYEYDDLFQMGCIGLMKACRSFDKNKGYAFSTLAYRCIKNAIQREVERGKSVNENGDFKVYSLDYESQKDGYYKGIEVIELVEFDGVENIEDLVENRILIEQAFSCLRDKEINIVKMFYIDEMKQNDIASSLGNKQQNISRDIKNALKKMRKELECENKKATKEPSKVSEVAMRKNSTSLYHIQGGMQLAN
jgi:RNA polymerase sporulation-specific sigma factor